MMRYWAKPYVDNQKQYIVKVYELHSVSKSAAGFVETFSDKAGTVVVKEDSRRSHYARLALTEEEAIRELQKSFVTRHHLLFNADVEETIAVVVECQRLLDLIKAKQAEHCSINGVRESELLTVF